MKTILGALGFGRPALGRGAAAILLAAGLQTAGAHPGHGLHEHGLGHALTSPDHAAVLLVIGASLWSAGLCLKSGKHARLFRWAGVGAVLVSVGLFTH